MLHIYTENTALWGEPDPSAHNAVNVDKVNVDGKGGVVQMYTIRLMWRGREGIYRSANGWGRWL